MRIVLNGNGSIEIDIKHDDVNCNHLENKDGMKIVNKSIIKYKKHIEDIAKEFVFVAKRLFLHTKFIMHQNNISKKYLIFFGMKK